MKKTYVPPTLKTQPIALGVFGQYGRDNQPDDVPHPIKVTRYGDLTRG